MEENPDESSPPAPSAPRTPKVLVCGVGGAGIKTLTAIAPVLPAWAGFRAVDCELAALAGVAAPVETVALGESVTKGWSSSGDLALARSIFENERQRLDGWLNEVDLLVTVVGLGAGFGTAAAEALAAAAIRREVPHLVFAFKPFSFEGGGRRMIADDAVGNLRPKAHGLVIIANDLLSQAGAGGEDLSAPEAIECGNRWVRQALGALLRMIGERGLISQDLGALLATLGERGGRTLLSVASGGGPSAVSELTGDLARCPLLDPDDVDRKVDHLLVHISGGPRLGLAKVNQLSTRLAERFQCREDVRVAAAIDPALEDRIEVCILGKVEFGRSKSGTPVADGRHDVGAPAPAGGLQSEKTQSTHRSGEQSRRPKGRKRKEDDRQSEFAFVETSNQRGFFDESEATVIHGEDIDVPTYLRRGIVLRS